ncbi:MAG: thermonuclease family protein [Candidatus Omnitrophica bacterium]|nr:thermonuclease family protein [Candidatus Omnitrophota bacterium]
MVRRKGEMVLRYGYVLLLCAALCSGCAQTAGVRHGTDSTKTAVGFAVAIPYGKQYTYERVLVTGVIDGDTLKLENGERVRLIGIDTPESKKNKKLKKDAARAGAAENDIVALGKEAAKFTTELVNKKYVRLEFDVQQRDKYERLLAYVYILDQYKGRRPQVPAGYYLTGDKKNPDLFLNATIIGSGYASQMTIPPNVRYAELFRKLYRQAREDNRGLWR